MNWKPTWVLLAAAALVLAFIVLVEQPSRRERARQASRLVLPGLNPSQITNVEIHPWGQSIIQAVRPNAASNSWRLVRPVSYPAHSQRLAALLQILSKLEWLHRVSDKDLRDRPEAEKEFGFTEPRYTLLLQGDGVEQRLEIGKLGAYNDTVFLQVVGNTAIYDADAKLLTWLPRDNTDWRDWTLLSLTNLFFHTLHIRAPGTELELERNATNHLWFMTKPLVGRADTPKINDLLDQLQKVAVSGFMPDNPQTDLETYGLQNSDTTPELALTFLDGTNILAGLVVGHSPPKYPDFVFVRRDNPGNVVVVAKEAFKPWQAPYSSFLDQHFISQSPGLIDSIAVRGEDSFVVRKQTNGQWQVAAGREFPADATLMDYWLTSFTNVSTEIAKTVATDLSPYGLSNPILQYTIRFDPAASAPGEARIDFGTNQTGQAFERRVGEFPVNTVSATDFSLLPHASWQLRDRQVWNFDSSNVVSVTVSQLGSTNKYLRDPDGNWTYAPGLYSPVKIDWHTMEDCVSRLGRLRAVFWDAVGYEHLERFGFAKTDHQIEFEVRQGTTNQIYRLEFGARSPMMHPYASVARNGERLVFEFPADLYYDFVEPNLTLYSARRYPP